MFCFKNFRFYEFVIWKIKLKKDYDDKMYRLIFFNIMDRFKVIYGLSFVLKKYNFCVFKRKVLVYYFIYVLKYVYLL